MMVRYEQRVGNFLGFVHLGCILILLTQYLSDELQYLGRHELAITSRLMATKGLV